MGENMRKIIILGVMIFMAALWMGNVQAGIQGSKHDFSKQTWNTTGEICVVCHTPHNAGDNIIPLWSHTTTKSTFTVYSSATLNAKVGQPSGVSLACLSCHDGTVALDAYGGQPGTSANIKDYADPTTKYNPNLGTDLSNDHPISFTYDSALATTSGDLQDPSTASSGVGNTIQKDFLRNNKVECISCHDVHNGANSQHLLVKGNAGSALCLTCHKK